MGPSTETSITRMRRCSTSTSRRTSTVRCSGFERTRSRKRRSGPRSLVGTSTWPRSSNLALRRSPCPEFFEPHIPLSTKDQTLSAELHGEALLTAKRPELQPLIDHLREVAQGRDEIRVECAGVIAGSWFAGAARRGEGLRQV